MTTVGFLYPGHAAEDDYPRMERILGDGVRLLVAHTDGEDLHAVDALLDLGAHHRLVDGFERLRPHGPQAVVWACTSGSFVFGWDGAAAQVDKLATATGLPASSTSFAFVRAAHALGVRKVAVAASYPPEVAERFVGFLADGGIEVISLTSAGIVTAAEVGRLPDEDVVRLAAGNDHPDAEALLIPDTAMRTVGLLPRLESELGKPVLTANQVTVWEGLRLVGDTRSTSRAGALFRTGTGENGSR
ncbi:maleate cis-trans isomerase family protein [Gandjariella thermophila]|uniref:Arylmalonate decarboxylase n=1 Tax=Gandjariella thermophila TaxID=1931992 RepID=A0A4D4JI48_9PSEU|nr:maleate cis-trans isomerase [Gandjariella thermophila]GDY33573.1 arylmalonate decarboxylase [Gandjariella thermophila]